MAAVPGQPGRPWATLAGRTGRPAISDWDAQRYDRFAAQRGRAGADLLHAVGDLAVSRVTDLGCGSGLSTALIAGRWPAARITGLDSSPAMLERARERVAGARFIHADIADYDPGEAQDLLVANASLHWLDEHRLLFPRLLSRLRPGGMLALQMPDNWNEPSHRLMRDIAGREQFRNFYPEAPGKRRNLLPVADYYDCLAPHCDVITAWETRYYHTLESPAAIVDWFASTGLKPWLEALPGVLPEAFLAAYGQGIRDHYPSRADGRVLLAMPRLFIIAQRAQ